jgi:mRNA interferase RelE/StbE
MACYRILFRESVYKDLRGIPRAYLKRILRRIESLTDDPRPSGCEKLTGQERYRIRQGNYRIVYSIQDHELQVWVVRVSHRKDVYR